MMGLSLSIPEGKEYDPIKAAADVADLMEHHRKRLDRAIELYDLEQEGRLVVLPCKVGDTIWRIKCSGEWPDIGKPYIEADAFLYRDIHYFGKTVFLTREEAEAELRGEDNG